MLAQLLSPLAWLRALVLLPYYALLLVVAVIAMGALLLDQLLVFFFPRVFAGPRPPARFVLDATPQCGWQGTWTLHVTGGPLPPAAFRVACPSYYWSDNLQEPAPTLAVAPAANDIAVTVVQEGSPEAFVALVPPGAFDRGVDGVYVLRIAHRELDVAFRAYTGRGHVAMGTGQYSWELASLQVVARNIPFVPVARA